MLAIKSGFGLISAILSAVSFKMIYEEITKKGIEQLFKSEEALNSLKDIGDNLMEVWPTLIIDIVLIVILIIELYFIWYAIIEPFIWKKYHYHEEMIRDLKAYKLFRKYHESYENFQAEEESAKKKKPIIFKRILIRIFNWLTKERHLNFRKEKAQKKNK